MLAFLLVGSLAVSAPVPKALKTKYPPDPERLLGAWDIELNEVNGTRNGLPLSSAFGAVKHWK